MFVYSFELHYFDETKISPIDGEEYLAGSLVFFIQKFDLDTAKSTFEKSLNLALEYDLSYKLVDTLVVSDVGYTLSVNYSKEYGFVVNFDYPHNLFIDNSAFLFLAKYTLGDTISSPVKNEDSSFSFSSLNGNCGSLSDGSIVNVVGLDGDFEVVSSQFAWNDSVAQSSMIIYKLSKNGAFCLAPDVYVSAKAS